MVSLFIRKIIRMFDCIYNYIKIKIIIYLSKHFMYGKKYHIYSLWVLEATFVFNVFWHDVYNGRSDKKNFNFIFALLIHDPAKLESLSGHALTMITIGMKQKMFSVCEVGIVFHLLLYCYLLHVHITYSFLDLIWL